MSLRSFAASAVVVFLLVFVVAILWPQPATPPRPATPPTPAPTRRPVTPTATPTIEARILTAIGRNDRDGAPQPDILITDPAVLVTFAAKDGLTAGSILRSSQAQTVAIARVVEAFTARADLFIVVTAPLTDIYGNTTEGEVMRLRITRPTLEKINFDAFRSTDLPQVADVYWQHPAFAR